MALNRNVLVDVPEKGVLKRKVGDNTYAYYAVRTYRNEKGRPTCDRVSIGKIDDDSGKLIPNRNYYEVFQKQPTAFMDTIARCGTFGVFSELAERLGLRELIEKNFDDCSDEMLSAAHYMLCGNSAMYLMEDWIDDHITFSTKSMTSPEISRMFEGIDADNTTGFFKEWINKRKYKELIAYDVTSISTYAKGIENAEWGYNRDEESLPQINFGMFYGQESRLPLYYRSYPGSINDKTHLKCMAEDTDMLEMKKAYFVMDRGFYTEENLKFLTAQGIRFMISVPGTLNLYNEMIDKHRDEIVNKYDCLIDNGQYFGKCYEVNKYGFRMNVHVFYNPDKVAGEVASFTKRINEWEEDLTKMETVPGKSSNYCKFFNITAKDGYLVFEKNIETINTEMSRCGFFMIAETVFTEKTADVLDIYRQRDVIEKGFDDLKNELDIKRLRCHRDKTAEGKMFVAFIALIIRSAMEKELKTYIKEHHMTFRKVLNELDKIKVIYAPQKAIGYRLLNPITKTQREILECLGMNDSFIDHLV